MLPRTTPPTAPSLRTVADILTRNPHSARLCCHPPIPSPFALLPADSQGSSKAASPDPIAFPGSTPSDEHITRCLLIRQQQQPQPTSTKSNESSSSAASPVSLHLPDH